MTRPHRIPSSIPTYHPGEHNRCPGCLKSNWLLGRVYAQCGFCGNALVIATSGRVELEVA